MVFCLSVNREHLWLNSATYFVPDHVSLLCVCSARRRCWPIFASPVYFDWPPHECHTFDWLPQQFLSSLFLRSTMRSRRRSAIVTIVRYLNYPPSEWTLYWRNFVVFSIVEHSLAAPMTFFYLTQTSFNRIYGVPAYLRRSRANHSPSVTSFNCCHWNCRKVESSTKNHDLNENPIGEKRAHKPKPNQAATPE